MRSYLPKGTKKPARPKGVTKKMVATSMAALRDRGGQEPKRTPRTPPKPEVNPGTAPKKPVGRKPSTRPTPSRPTRGPIKPMPRPTRPGSGPRPKPKTPTRPSRPTRRPTRRSPMVGIRRSLRGMRGQR